MKIGFIGTGRITPPMARALAGKGHDILVSERSRSVSSELAAAIEEVTVVTENQVILDQSEVVFLCLLAGVARQILPGLKFRPEHRVVSAMADIETGEIRRMIGDVEELCVTIPLPFIDQGGCPLPVYPESKTLAALFGENNPIIPLAQESTMKHHFAATAILSTLMKELATARDWLSSYTGDQGSAESFVASVVGGYLSAMPKDGQDRLGEALQDLSTEGGLNTQLLGHMTGVGTMEELQQGLQALAER